MTHSPSSDARSTLSGEPVSASAMSSRSWSAAQIVLAASLPLWLGVLLLRTGPASLRAAWHVSLFLLELLVLTILTRTVRVKRLLIWVMLGAASFGVAWLGGAALSLIEHRPTAAHYILIPVFEELCKLGVVASLLWRGRSLVTWTLGATDVLLMSAAVGGGFQFMEDAYILHHQASIPSVGLDLGGAHAAELLPTVAIEGGRHVRYIAGHALWAALVGALLGVALLIRHRNKGVATSLAVAGVAWAVVDHIRVNYTNHLHGAAGHVLQWLTGDGSVTLVLFLTAVIAAVVIDVYVSWTVLPGWPELALRFLGGGRLGDDWKRERNRRALAYLVFRARTALSAARAPYVRMIMRVGPGFFLERYHNLRSVGLIDAAAMEP